MPVTATLLGSAIAGATDDVAIPITVDQPAGSVVLVAAFASTGPGHFWLTQGFRQAPTDPEPLSQYSMASPHVFVGNTGATPGVFGSSATAMNIVSAVRIGGAPLTASGGGPAPRPGCSTCGSMLLGTVSAAGGGSGDTVTIYWLNHDGPPTQSVACVVAFSGIIDTNVLSDQTEYSNGDAYPDLGSNPQVLSWDTDIGPGSAPTPVSDCAPIAIAAAYGTNGWGPTSGSTVAEVTDGTIYMAIVLDTFAAGGVVYQPGGSFAGPGFGLVANYILATIA